MKAWQCEKCGTVNSMSDLKCNGCTYLMDPPFSADYFEHRGAGRSTVIALNLIATTIQNPMKWYPVEDHYYRDQRRANRHLLDLICDIVRKNDFDMEVDSQRLRIRSLHMGYKVTKEQRPEKIKPKVD